MKSKRENIKYEGLKTKKTEVIVTHIHSAKRRKSFFLPEISTSILKRGKREKKR